MNPDDIRRENNALRKANDALRKENAKLQARVKALTEDGRRVERIRRLALNGVSMDPVLVQAMCGHREEG